MCWKNPAYRAARRNRQHVAKLSPATQRSTAPWTATGPGPGSDPGDVLTPARLGNGGHWPWDEDRP
jgi:hypothetical protein